MTVFGTVPPEPPIVASLDGLAPLFASSVANVLGIMAARGFPAKVAESVRTAARQTWLYGMGRQYNDGRGVVTNAPSGRTSWHFYGLAGDIVSLGAGWDVPGAFWSNLQEAAHLAGLVSGMDWRRSRSFSVDRPHVQWGHGMRNTPSPHAYALYLTGGSKAVWTAVGAI